MSGLFQGKWVLVTGSSSGLGEEFARQLAALGAHLVLTARSRPKLESLARELEAGHGVQTRVVVRDLGAPGGALALATEVDALRLPIEHLVNNAGFGTLTRFARSQLEREVEMVRLNCESLLVLTRYFLPPMLERRSGGVIHVASIAGCQPAPYFSTYGATKAFVISLSAAIGAEVRSSGVRVMALCPGPVPTGFQRAAGMGDTDLRKQDLRTRLSVLSPDDTVRRGLRAYERRRDVYVPGLLNQIVTFATKLAPRALVVNAAMRSIDGRARVAAAANGESPRSA